MSKNINVNPDHYKTGGREPQGEAMVQKDHKAGMASVQHDLSARSSQRQKTLERKASAIRERTGAQKDLFEPEDKAGKSTVKRAKAGSAPKQDLFAGKGAARKSAAKRPTARKK